MKTNLIAILILFCITITAKTQVNFVWGKQIGTTSEEKTRSLTSDENNNVYIFGKTMGTIGDKNYGKNDGFIVKIDKNGNVQWSVQVGTAEDDDIVQATVDPLGNVYTVGSVINKGMGATKNNADVLVVKINPDGQIAWQKQYGTDSLDSGNNIIADKNGDVYIIGETAGKHGKKSFGKTDCFILQLNADGEQKNVVQFGTSEFEACTGIVLKNNGEIYVCGFTTGDLAAKNTGKADVFWGILSADLEIQQMKQFGTAGNDYAGSIKSDAVENVIIAGCTDGNIGAAPKGNGDAFVCKLDKNGKILWKKQFGSASWDGVNGLEIVNDNVVISGCRNYPNCESFCKMYDAGGKLVWSRDYVTQGEGGGTCGKGIQVKSDGTIYHAGYTGGNLFSELQGKHDLFLLKLQLVESELN